MVVTRPVIKGRLEYLIGNDDRCGSPVKSQERSMRDEHEARNKKGVIL